MAGLNLVTLSVPFKLWFNLKQFLLSDVADEIFYSDSESEENICQSKR